MSWKKVQRFLPFVNFKINKIIHLIIKTDAQEIRYHYRARIHEDLWAVQTDFYDFHQLSVGKHV